MKRNITAMFVMLVMALCPQPSEAKSRVGISVGVEIIGGDGGISVGIDYGGGNGGYGNHGRQRGGYYHNRPRRGFNSSYKRYRSLRHYDPRYQY